MADQSQLDIETQINAALRQRAALMEQNKSALVDQVAIAQELCRALDCESLDGFNDRLTTTRELLNQGGAAAGKVTTNTKNMSIAAKKSAKSFFSFKGAAVGAAVAMKNAFGKVGGVLKSIGSLAMGLVKGAFSIFRGAFQAYNGMMDGLFQKAQEGSNAGIGLRNAYEKVKETLGDLGTGAGKAAIDSFDKLKSSGKNLAGTGISLSRMFGRGPDGLAAALEFVNEQISGLGPQIDRFAGQMADAAEEVLVMGKSLGFTGEDFARMGTMAGYAGETLKETMQRLMKQIVGVSKEFSVNSRVMAANFKVMMKMPAIFGSNTKEMLKTSVAAQKLGMSIEELTAATGVFDDFESGATAAADLAAEFGIVVDAMDMMTATPAEQVMMLKSALDQSGQSFEQMSRQERARLADLTGMDATAIQKMMDPSNAFDKKDMDNVNKGIDNSKHATMKLVEATKELAKALAQVNEAGEPLSTSGGFFGAWVDGVTRGFTRSKEFRAILDSVYASFKIVFNEGKKVGAMLATLIGPDGPFQFISQYFTNLEAKMSDLMPKITGHFETFVEQISSKDPEVAVQALNNLLNNIINEFSGSDGATSGLFDAFKQALDLVFANLIYLAPTLAKGLNTLFLGAIALMTGDYSMFADAMGKDLTMPMTIKALDAIKDDKTINKMGETFMIMIHTFWDKFGEPITAFLGAIIGGAFIAAIVQALPMIAAAGALKGLASGIMSKFGGAMAGATADGAAGSATKDMTFGKKMEDFFLNVASTVEILAEIWNSGFLGDAIKTLAVMGAAFGVAMLGFVGIAVLIQKSGVSAVTVAVTTLAIYGVAKAAEAIGNMTKVLEKVKITKSVAIKVAAVIGAMILVMGAIAGIMVMTIKALSGIEIKEGFVKVVQGAADLTMAVAKATALIVGMAAIMILIATFGSNPVGAGIIVAALLGSSMIFYAVAKLVKGIVTDFAGFEAGQAEKAMKASKAAGNLTEVLVTIIGELKGLVKLQVNKKKFETGVKTIKDIMSTIKTHLLPTAISVGKLMQKAGGKPEQVERSIKLLVTLMDAFKPLADMMISLLAIKDLNLDQMSTLINRVNGSLSKVFLNMKTLVRETLTIATSFGTASELKSLEAVGPVLGAVANIMTAIAPSAELVRDSTRRVMKFNAEVYKQDSVTESSSVAWGAYSTSRTGGAVTKSGYQEAGEEIIEGSGMANVLKFASGMGLVLEAITPAMEKLVKSMASIEIPGSAASIRSKMAKIGVIMEAVSKSMDAITKVRTLTEDKLGSTVIGNIRREFMHVAGLFATDGRYDNNTQPPLQYSLAKIACGIDTTMKELAGKTESIPKFTQALNNIIHVFGAVAGINSGEAATFGAKMSALVSGFQGMEGVFTSAAVKPMIDMIKAFNEIGEELSSSSNIIEVDTLLSNVTDALTMSDANEYTIKKSNVQVTVKLNVTMDVDKVAKTMITAERVTPGPAYDENLNLRPGR